MGHASPKPWDPAFVWPLTERQTFPLGRSPYLLVPSFCTLGCNIRLFIFRTRRNPTFGTLQSEHPNPSSRLLYYLISRTASSCRRTCSECSTRNRRWKMLRMVAFQSPPRNRRMSITMTLAFLMAHTIRINILLEAMLRGILVVETCLSTLLLTGKRISRAQAI